VALFVRHKKPGPLKPTANPYPSRIQRWRQSLGVTFVFLLLIGGVLRFYSPFYETLQGLLFEGTAVVQSVSIQPFSQTKEVLQTTKTFANLREEHAQLKSENEDLKWQLQTLKPLKHENEALRNQLKVPSVEDQGHLLARILSSPYDGLHHFFLIQAGGKQGLEKDQAVVSPEGVVGRLEKVGAHISRVLLLNDVNSRIPVKTSQSEQMAILAGDGRFLPALVYVADVRKIQKGELIVTSGLGGIFPPGLPVGLVDSINGGNIRVRPFVPFRKLEWVRVLKPVSETYLDEVKSELEGE
jgi:rod shape-determining protein MreC